MALNQKQQIKALAHLKSKWTGERKCQVCKSDIWNVHPELYELRQFNEGNMVLGGPLVPLLVIECTNCGNTIFMNAMRASVVSPDKKEGDSNDRE